MCGEDALFAGGLRPTLPYVSVVIIMTALRHGGRVSARRLGWLHRGYFTAGCCITIIYLV